MTSAGGAETRLRITEIFFSLQGEGSRVGWPTVFVRLTGCPLRCVWCDTAYAFHGGTLRALDDILAEVASHAPRHVCVTGGEPLAQAACLQLLAALCDTGYDVSLETSGALDIAQVDSRVARIVDLKAPGSGESARNRWENLAHLGARDELKLVLANEADYLWAREVIHRHGLDGICSVLLSPVAEALPAADLAEWILRDRLPARMQLQLHKVIWGNVPGR